MVKLSDINAIHFYSLFACLHILMLMLFLPFAVEPISLSTLCVLFVSLALIYDNIVIAVGHKIVNDDKLFLALSRPRFILHLIGTPLLTGVALEKTYFANV